MLAAAWVPVLSGRQDILNLLFLILLYVALGVATLSDSTHVVTAGGLPLYRFAQDEDSGDAYGEGLATFGGVWHVVKVGQPTSAAAPRRS